MNIFEPLLRFFISLLTLVAIHLLLAFIHRSSGIDLPVFLRASGFVFLSVLFLSIIEMKSSFNSKKISFDFFSSLKKGFSIKKLYFIRDFYNKLFTKFLDKEHVVVNRVKKLVIEARNAIALMNNKMTAVYLVILGIIFRLVLISRLPLSNDEGYYLYDAYLIKQGLIPLRDFLTKSLPHIYVLFATLVFGNNLYVSRILSVLVFAANSYLIYKITTRFSKNSSYFPTILALAFYSLYPDVVSITSYIHTEMLQSFFIMLFTYIFLFYKDNSVKKDFYLGLIFIVSYFTRPSSIILFGGVFIYRIVSAIIDKKIVKNLLLTLRFLGVLFLINIIALIAVSKFVGIEKTLDNIYGIQIIRLTASGSTKLSIIGMLLGYFSNFRTVAFYFFDRPIFLFTIALVFSVILPRFKKIITAFFFSILIVWLTKNYVLTVSTKYLVGNYAEGMMTAVLLAGLFFSKDSNGKFSILDIDIGSYLAGWLIAFTAVYSVWIKFRIPYFSESFPIIVVMMSYGFYNLFRKKQANFYYFLVIAAIVISSIRSFFVTYTGTYSPSMVYKVAEFVQKETKDSDTVLSGFMAFPFEAERKIPLNVSHPIWYSYANFDVNLIKQYMPVFTDFQKEIFLNPPKIILYDQITADTFFKTSIAMQEFLKNRYVVKKTFTEISRGAPRSVIVYELIK